MDDPRSDEDLILAFYAGETAVLDIIFNRYLKPLRFYILKDSWRKDDGSLDDIIQETFLIFLKSLKQGEKDGFQPTGAGSFRAWFYTVARNACRTYNRKQSQQPLNVSKSIIETAPAKPVEPALIKKEEAKDRKKQLRDILSSLSTVEQELMKLVSEGVPYDKIKGMSMFSKYSIDYLMLKVYNIRKKLLRLKA
jgi:RNA polymerase sigma factor (sigma-70 family)